MEKVDVLAVLDAHEQGMRWASETKTGLTLSPQGCGNLSAELRTVRAAMAEMIAASKELLRGSNAQACAIHHRDLYSDDEFESAESRASHARDRIRAALARIGGA